MRNLLKNLISIIRDTETKKHIRFTLLQLKLSVENSSHHLVFAATKDDLQLVVSLGRRLVSDGCWWTLVVGAGMLDSPSTGEVSCC